MKPIVSVIIPVYNSGEYLEETLDSVNAQSFKELEVIIVDNGSEEVDTVRLLEKLATQYTVLYSGKTGVSVARNEGIKAAEGTYILALDSDDLIQPSFIEKCVAKFNPKVKAVRTQVELFGQKKGRMVFDDFSFSTLLARNMMVVTTLFRKSDAEKIGGFDPDFKKGFEDWEFWINLLKEGGEVVTINEALFKYRLRKGSRNNGLRQQDLKKLRAQIWEKHKELYGKHFVDPTECFEYKFIADSKANRLGNLLLAPFSKFKLMNE